MRITKREHACLDVEKNGERLIIDPGSFTAPFDVDGIVAVVVTHEHPDHWTPEHLSRILDANPGIPIYGPPGVVSAAKDFAVTAVAEGDEISAGGFTLRFFGRDHAVIHSSIPVVNNVGVLVDGTLYYPGDSYTVPPVAVELLATPAGGPWLKIGEVIDFVLTVRPARAFPTHTAPLSPIGIGMVNSRLTEQVATFGGTYLALEPGDTIDA
ncbi:MBL fold metallo-hydrolase [Salinibacterium hongtaonis]|uniref:MBL fold metallo-hydrolase n=1 Tax=Homoserinimonas hongtaonis TaxID=2079791 RepID=A0A2U1SZU3_9MICO|nr:MBL fold metallo-hydrolase [Salinibacterium hongtaonis]AWB89689.1 MBL fold metallo-hydrolase [Salinibacterium hongtaonis]PWB97141.1 MBL fold metallo-hydrolase [Salinibacterium hongtaonis]